MQSAFGTGTFSWTVCPVAIELLRRTFVKNDGLWGPRIRGTPIFGLHGRGTRYVSVRRTSWRWCSFALLADREDPWQELGGAGSDQTLHGSLLLIALLLKRWRVLTIGSADGLVLSVTSLMLLGPRTFVAL